MRFLVTKNIQEYSEDVPYITVTPEECLRYFSDKKIIGLDLETKGFDPYTKDIILCQLGDSYNQYAIDSTIDLTIFKDLLEDQNKLYILHNAKFDLRFFYHKGIVINNVFDTFLAEKLLYLGYPSGMHGLSLQSCCREYLGVELDKSVRGALHVEGTSDRVIVYGCEDVRYLEDLMNAQLRALAKKDLLKAIEVENKFVIVLAYVEYCGVKISERKWKDKMFFDLAHLQKATNSLNKWVEENIKDPKFVYVSPPDLFTPYEGDPQCIINWSSSKQVGEFFESLGLNITITDKKTKGTRKSVDAKVIKPQKNKSPVLLGYYLDYKAYEKTVSTYGQTFLDSINPVSGRIHTVFNQLMDTGRLSSGGGVDRDTGTNLHNFQNIPSQEETRACFVSEENNLWISADYCGQESVILANVSEDEAMIEVLKNRGDIHSLVAKMIFPEEIGNCAIENIRNAFPALRKEAKGPEFLINYGGNDMTMMFNYGWPIEKARKIYSNYMTGFPGVKKYQDSCRAEVMRLGYILLNPLTKHKAFIYDFEELKDKKRTMSMPGFWDAYNLDKKNSVPSERIDIVRSFARRRADSEKQSINYRIQGTGAVMFKIASIKLFNVLQKKGWLFKVKYTIPCHDEINLEAPKEIAEELSQILVKCMRDAGDIFCKLVPLDAEVKIGDHWIH